MLIHMAKKSGVKNGKEIYSEKERLRPLIHCWWLVGMLPGPIPMENSMKVSNKFKIELPNNPEIPFLDVILRTEKHPSLLFIVTLSTIAKT